MKVKDLRDLSHQDLLDKEKSFKKELFALNFQRKVGAVEKPSRFQLLKRDIARILTIIKERELENERREQKERA